VGQKKIGEGHIHCVWWDRWQRKMGNMLLAYMDSRRVENVIVNMV